MAGTFEGARAGVHVYPDTKGFASELNRKLHEIQDIYDLNIPANFDPDTTRLRETIKKYNGDAFDITANFNPDTRALDAALRRLKVERPHVKVDVDLDKKRMQQEMLRGTYKVKTEIEAPNPVNWFDQLKKREAERVKLERENTSLIGEQMKKLGSMPSIYRAMTKANRENNQTSKEDLSLISQRLKQMRSLREAYHKLTPLGGDFSSNFNVDRYIERYERLQKKAEAGRITYNFDTDGYAKVISELETVARKARDANDKQVRIKFWTDGADKIDKELNNLRTKMLNIPNSLSERMESLSEKYRKAAVLSADNPDYKYEANLDLDTAKAREEFEKFNRKHDKLEIDAEIETLGASAHLAYLTRPRTVNIFAKVRDTNVGKILQGITYGATGLQGVTNQFDRLANTLNKVDKYVPRLATIGSILGSISAGAINLSGSLGAVGLSLATMSKGLLAAPALIGAFGSAMWLMRGFSDKKAYKFDWESTALGGMQDKSLKAFWDGVTPKLKEVANQIAPTMNKEFLGIAKAYGTTTANILDMVQASDKMGVLPKLLENSRLGVEKLGQPLATLTEGFLALGDQSSAMFPRMVGWLNKPATIFRDWVKSAENSGAVVRALAEAAEQGSYLKNILFDLVDATGKIFTDFANGQNGLEQFSNTVTRFNNAVHSVRFTETIHAWVDGAKRAQTGFRDSFSDMGNALYKTRTVVGDVFADMGKITGGLISTISKVVGANGTGIANMSSGIATGFERMFKAVQENKSVFGDLFTTIGSLSKAFGTTLAASLRAATPLLSATAKTATAVAELFSKMPPEILGAIGLWKTFGKGGLDAISMLREGLAQHLVQLANYRMAMTRMGAAEFSGGSFADMLAAWGKHQLVMKEMANGASTTSAALATVNATAGKQTSTFGKLQLAGKGLLASMGGLSGLLTTGAIGAGIAAVTVAWSSYSQHTQAAKEATDSVIDSLGKVADAKDVAQGLNSVGAAFKKQLDTGIDLNGGFDGWLSGLTDGLSGTKDAARVLHMNTTEIAKAMQTADGYDKMQKKLQKTIQEGTTVTHYATGYSTGYSKSQTLEAQAAEDVSESMRKQRDSLIEELQAQADANDHAKINVRRLIEQGADYNWLSAQIADTTTQHEMLAQAQSMLLDSQQKQAQSYRNVDAAGVRYAQTLDTMGQSISAVQALTSQGQSVWNASTNSFNIFSEAGRTAQSALGSFSQTALEYVQAMVSAHKPQAQVVDTMKQMRDSFIDTAQQMGLNKQQAAELADQYGLIPKQVKTMFEADTAQAKMQMLQYLQLLSPILDNDTYTMMLNAVNDGAITSLEQLDQVARMDTRPRTLLVGEEGTSGVIGALQNLGLQAELSTSGKDLIITGNNDDAMAKIAQVAGAHFDPKSQTVTINKDAWEKVKNAINSWQPDTKFIKAIANVTLQSTLGTPGAGQGPFKVHKATGGLVRGAGTGTSDSIPALLSNGEFVLKAAAVKKLAATYGVGFLNRMNQTGSIPASYANEIQYLIATSKHIDRIAKMQGTTVIVNHDDKAVIAAIDKTRSDVVGAIRDSNQNTYDPFAEKRFNEAVYRAVNQQSRW